VALVDLWNSSPEQIQGKHVQQIIAFAGSGKLRDGENAATEYRQLLSQIPSIMLAQYVDECLSTRFDDSGFALQDIVNEVGRRLNYSVTFGRYRGVRSTQGQIGFDGLWESTDEKSIVVEVKTTDAYRIDLDVIAGYRRKLVQLSRINENKSSILIVVGREDTGDLEAQVRGSRHAWDIRLISAESLLRLLRLKENVEDPIIVRKIRDVLTPQEFTKVDGIVDIVFSAAEDVRQGDGTNTESAEDVRQNDDTYTEVEEPTQEKPVAQFNDACIARIQTYLKRIFIKQSRTIYDISDGSLAIICAVSREHPTANAKSYWFAFHPYQKQALEKAQKGYISFGCGSEDAILLIPFEDFASWLDALNTTTQSSDRFYWHVRILYEQGQYTLTRKRGYDRPNLDKYLLPP